MDSNLKPTVSIIMPAYNAAEYIEMSIQSVLDQTYHDWELLIINDGSTDRTASIAEKYVLKDDRIKLLNQENKRLGAARNTGFKNASGDFIAFLDSDDLWLPHKLEVQIDFLNNNPNIDVIFSDGYTLFENKNIKLDYHLSTITGFYPGQEMFSRLYDENEIPVLSVVLKRKWIEIIGYQDEDKYAKGSEDLDYWLRMAKAGAQFYGLANKLFIYRVHNAGMSAQVSFQKFSTFNILIKNFEPHVFDKSKRRKIFFKFADLIKGLKHSGYADEGNLSATKLYLIYNNPSIRFFSKILGKSNGIIAYISIKNLFASIWSLSGLKRLIKKTAKLILKPLFNCYQTFDSYKGRLNFRFYKWKYGDRLETNGYFSISGSSHINIESDDARLISYGLFLGDYSTITLADKSQLVIAKAMIYKYCNFNIWNANVIIGNNVLFNNYCSLNCLGKIEIGDDTWFGEGVRLYDHNHKFRDEKIPFTNQGFTIGEIKIGSNCWIGANTVILKGVTIGDNCVIGANNLIYKSIPENTIVKAKTMEIMEKIIR